jgi:hypothetical protein
MIGIGAEGVVETLEFDEGTEPVTGGFGPHLPFVRCIANGSCAKLQTKCVLR